MCVPKTSDHIQINIRMQNSSQAPPASSKLPNQDLTLSVAGGGGSSSIPSIDLAVTKKIHGCCSIFVLIFQVDAPWSFWYIICVHITLGSGAMGSQSQLLIKFYKYEILWRAKLADFELFLDCSCGTPWYFFGLFSLQPQREYPQIYWVKFFQPYLTSQAS